MSIHVSYNQPDNEIHSYDGKPSAVVTGAGPAVIEIHMTAGEWDAANRLYYRQEATGVDGFVQASESNNQQFLLPCAYLASGELQIALNNPEQGLTTNLMKISITKMSSSSGDLSDDDPQFTIDGKKRLVLVPGSQGILAVQFDNESESVTFKFPRYQDGVDLSTKTPYVNYKLPSSGELGKATCVIDTGMLTDEFIYFSWTIDINVTMFEGSIKFQVEFSDTQGYRWQSQIAELPILTSLYNTGLEPYSPSFLEEALRQMQQYSSDAEAFAVGTRNGVPVAEGDPAYHKSALYLSNWFFERSVKPEAKEALLFLLEHVAYTDEHGQQYLGNLRDELYDTAEVVGIAATFVQDGVVYDTDSLNSLKPMLTVLATYSDLSVREITAYTLSGTLTVGTSTIAVEYAGKTATFDVTVEEEPYPTIYFYNGANPSMINSGGQPTGKYGIEAAGSYTNTRASAYLAEQRNNAVEYVIQYSDATHSYPSPSYPLYIPTNATKITVACPGLCCAINAHKDENGVVTTINGGHWSSVGGETDYDLSAYIAEGATHVSIGFRNSANTSIANVTIDSTTVSISFS